MKKKKKPSKQQAKLIKAVLDPKVKTLTEAGAIAGYASRQAAWDAVQSMTVQEAILEFQKSMHLGGIDDAKIVKRLGEALDAEETRFFQFQGNIVDQENVVDHATRLKAIELVVKIRGLIKGDKEPVKNTQVNVYNFRDARTEDLLRSINDQLRAIEEAELKGQEPINGVV
jgi:hypothetical protein